MTKNTLIDLNDHLFQVLERLNDDSLMTENHEVEIDRARAVVGISTQIISNAQTLLKAEEFKADYGLNKTGVKLLG